MGDIEGGILACAWSNDQEMLVIVTSIGSLVLLNNSFEVLNEGHVEGLDEMVSPSSVKISWRSDGENFCINYPSHASQVIRVYTKELELVSVSYVHFISSTLVVISTILHVRVYLRMCLGTRTIH